MNQENKQKIDNIKKYLNSYGSSSAGILGLAIIAIIITNTLIEYPSGLGALGAISDAFFILLVAAIAISILGVVLSIKFINKNVIATGDDEVNWSFIFLLLAFIIFLAVLVLLISIIVIDAPWFGFGVTFSIIAYSALILFMKFFMKKADINRKTVFLSILSLFLVGQLAVYVIEAIQSMVGSYNSYILYALETSIIPNLFIFILIFLPAICVSMVKLNRNFLNQEMQEISKE